MSDISRFEVSRQFHLTNYTMHSAHSHSYYELYYLIQGNCNLFIHDTVYALSSGCIAFIAANSLHKTTYTGDTPNERINIEFTDDYVPEILRDFDLQWLMDHFLNHVIVISPLMSSKVNALISNIFNEHNSQDPCAGTLLKMYLQELILVLIRYYQHSDYKVPSSQIRIADESMQKAMDYISANYKKKITLNDVASHLQLSSSYLSKKFKLVNGIGFAEYVNRVRITHAEKLLIETQMTINQISDECGYENSNYFGDTFRHINSISPSAFRKMKGEAHEEQREEATVSQQ